MVPKDLTLVGFQICIGTYNSLKEGLAFQCHVSHGKSQNFPHVLLNVMPLKQTIRFSIRLKVTILTRKKKEKLIALMYNKPGIKGYGASRLSLYASWDRGANNVRESYRNWGGP